jgi:hypothetical protein
MVMGVSLDPRLPSLCDFSRLYSDSLNQDITASKTFSTGVKNLRFRRAMVGQRKEQLLRMCGVCGDVNLSKDPDKLSCKLSDTGVFTVRSFYRALKNYGVVA